MIILELENETDIYSTQSNFNISDDITGQKYFLFKKIMGCNVKTMQERTSIISSKLSYLFILSTC